MDAPTNMGAPDATTILDDPCEASVGLQVGSPWPMYGRCATHPSRSVRTGPAAAPRLQWTFAADAGSYAEPVVDRDGRIYLGVEHETSGLIAVGPDGTERWRGEMGNVSTAVAISSNDTIYAGAGDDGGLVALRLDGSRKWIFPTTSEIDSAPTIAPDGTIYFGCVDGTFFAVNMDGTKKWEFAAGAEVAPNTAIGPDQTIYFATLDGKTHALAPDGGVRWSADTGTPTSPPSVSSSGSVYVAGDGFLYSIRGGVIEWRVALPGASSAAIGADGTLYVGATNGVIAVRSDGGAQWTHPTSGRVGAPVVGADGTIYAATDNAALIAVGPDGGAKWSVPTAGPSRRPPVIGADGRLYIATSTAIGTALQAFGP